MTHKPDITVRRLLPGEQPAACALAWEVFCQFDAPEDPPGAMDSFRSILSDLDYRKSLTFYGAFLRGELAGMLALRPPAHISLFFVRGRCQGLGVGRALFEHLRLDCPCTDYSVNAAPSAVPVYRRLGFAPDGPEQTVHHIRSVPMRFMPERKKPL